MKKDKKIISIVTPCFNEQQNVEELYSRVKSVMSKLADYDYEHICIDNASTDNTFLSLKRLALKDKKLKIIKNARNFGYLRSPYYAITQSSGDACIMISFDLQDPPELIPDFISKWEAGSRCVLAVKTNSEENKFIFFGRKLYYRFLQRISESPIIENATGAGLYDKSIVKILRNISDPYPYLRGILTEIGFNIDTVEFTQPKRKKGKTSGSIYTLYDVALLGITNHSKIPLRIITFGGMIISSLSLFVGSYYLLMKIFYWDSFDFGFAALITGFFFISGVQMLFLGILGEYIGSIHTKVKNFPRVIEAERINF